MQFYDVETTYYSFKKVYDHNDPEQFHRAVNEDYHLRFKKGKEPYFHFLKHVNAQSIAVDNAWYRAKMPYYKIWPGVFDTFIKTRLDIKADMLRFPHESFAILFPKTDDGMLTFNIYGKKTVVESIIVQGGDFRDEGSVGIVFKVIYRTDDIAYPGSFIKIVKMDVDKLIEQGIGTQGFHAKALDGDEYDVPGSIMDACVRLIVATIFLATGSHKVLEYDVLSKHLAVYREIRGENETQQKDYEQKALKKGKFGWNIGSGRGDRGLKLPNGTSYAKACQDAGGRELLYQHIRGGHWHSYRYGQGRKDIKIKWQEDITIRKDLLPRPLEV